MDEDYDEEENAALEAEESIAEQFSEKLNFSIEINSSIDNHIKSAINQLVTQKVGAAVEKLVNDTVKAEFEQAISHEIARIVEAGFSTPIKKFDYAGNVTESKSLEETVRDISENIATQGDKYKLTWYTGTGYNAKSHTGTIADLISNQVVLVVGERLKPQFEAIEKDFKEKSQAALRQYAVAAVDSATQKVLGGGR